MEIGTLITPERKYIPLEKSDFQARKELI